MADSDHVEWLKSGYKAWNNRRMLIGFKPDLAELDFHEAVPSHLSENRRHGFFKRFNLSQADLQGTKLSGLDFSNANFSKADLEGADLENGTFRNAKFRQADMSNVNAANADFENAVFRGANFEGAVLQGAILNRADFRGTDISDHQLESATLRNGEAFEHARDSTSGTVAKVWHDALAAEPSSSINGNRGRYLVLYGTNRKPILHNDELTDFGVERDDKLNLGSCEVFIPDSHKVGSIGSSFWKRMIKGDDRIKIRKLISLNGELYWRLVQENFSNGDNPCPPTIFIHGYNTAFKDAVKRAAQIGFDLGLNRGISLFSWPSQGTMHRYSADEASVEASRDYLVEFIVNHLGAANGDRLNIIAHSMGCRCLISALENIGLKHPKKLASINQIILAAADVDQDVMKSLGAYAIQNSGRTTSYACPSDKALEASNWLHSFPRVGLLPPVFLLDEVDTVEVEKTDLIELGHGYVAGAKSVLNDIFQLIQHSTPPPQRFSIQTTSTPSHWRLKE